MKNLEEKYNDRTKYSVYAIHDKVAEEYGNPMIARNDGMIKRILVDQLAKVPNPNDYEILEIGFYNIATGEITGVGHRLIHLGMVKDVEISDSDKFLENLT